MKYQSTHLLLQPNHARPLLFQKTRIFRLRIRLVIYVDLGLECIECIREVIGMQIFQDGLVTASMS